VFLSIIDSLDLVLSPADAMRVCRVVEKLVFHGVRKFALTGSLAMNVQLLAAGQVLRPLNDVDIVVKSFESIPASLSDVFLCRHIEVVRMPALSAKRLRGRSLSRILQ